MDQLFRQIGIAIGASKRLGWIALGLCIERLHTYVYMNPNVLMFEYYKSRNEGIDHLLTTMMMWADDYRMALFPAELKSRLILIDSCGNSYKYQEYKKSTLIRR